MRRRIGRSSDATHGRVLGPILGLIIVSGLCSATVPANACPASVAAALADVAKACRQPSCGAAIAVGPQSGPATTGATTCPAPGWDGLLAAIDVTLAQRGFVLLGEIHDNDMHHALRAAIIARGSSGPIGAAPVVFEQLTADQRAALAPYATAPTPASQPRPLSAFLAASDWERSAWSKTADYRPLFEAALASSRAIHPGDPGRDAMKRSARDGASGLSPEDRSRLQLDAPLGEALDQASIAEIEAAHCGMMPKSALGGMAFAQRFRDAHLALAVKDAAGETGGAILIAGNGHVRSDRGVPWYLARLAPGRPVLAVMFNEVSDAAATAPASEAGLSVSQGSASQGSAPASQGSAPANWVVLTPPNAARDPDPCAAMKAVFERMKSPKKAE